VPPARTAGPARLSRVALFGETVVDVAPRGDTPGGAPFNVAWHLHGLGFPTLLVTRVGRDVDGSRLLGLIRTGGLDDAGVQVDARRPTGRVLVREGAHGPEFEIPADQAFDAIDSRPAGSAFARARPRLLYFGTLAQRSAPSRAALRALLRRDPPETFLDVNLREPWFDAPTLARSLAAATTVKANEDELGTISAALDLGGAGLPGRAEGLLRAFPCRRLVVTRGSGGAALFTRRGRDVTARFARGRPLPGPAQDSVGAGDAFSAAFLCGLLRGWPAATTLARANALGAALCTVRGARPGSDDFYEPLRRRWGLA
jgi:fructokinase